MITLPNRKLKNAHELKYYHEIMHPDSHFFTRSTMKFFGDVMKNFGMKYIENGSIIELYRKQFLKSEHKHLSSYYFDAKTLEKISYKPLITHKAIL